METKDYQLIMQRILEKVELAIRRSNVGFEDAGMARLAGELARMQKELRNGN